MKNIFLTGDIQVGKSTLIKRILEKDQGQVCGFKTVPFYLNDESRLFQLNRFFPEQINNEQPLLVCKKTENGKLTGIPEVFDQWGVRILEACLNAKPDIIIMDELGLFESEAYDFQKSVWRCLDSPIPVLGVLKAKNSPFLDRVREREDVLIIEITEANREENYHLLDRLIKRVNYPDISMDNDH